MNQTDVVQTRLGAVRGEQLDGCRVYRGLPFAQPPTGNRRFCPPLPAEPWPGTLEARHFGSAAMQSGVPVAPRPPSVSEDCLYLNVWAPDGDPHDPPRAVLVWIHGGGQVMGATSDPGIDGAAFARSGVVFVSLAYRLGVFGFLKLDHLLGAQASDGNAALQDLLLGLRWVRQNITAFGGDPDRVTLAGESAGAKCAASVAAMPGSRGLVNRLILQSGSGLLTHRLDSAEALTELYLHELGLTPHEAPRLLGLPAEALLSAQERLLAASPNMFPFRPVVGVDSLPRIPQDRFGEPDLAALPLLIGSNRNEFDTFIAFGPPEAAAAEPTPAMCGHLTASEARTMLARYHAAYPELDGREFRSRFMSAEEYGVPTLRLAERHARAGGATYRYRFDWEPTDPGVPVRAGHGLDVPFVFKQVDAPASRFLLGTTPDREQLSETMHARWAEFTTTGSPGADWPRYTLPERQTMLLGTVSATASDPDGQERLLWEGMLRDEP